MRCVNCGRETEDGFWTTSGFICAICAESYSYIPCDNCGLRFPQAKMKTLAGNHYCESCYRELAPKQQPPKAKSPAQAATAVSLPAKERKGFSKPPEFSLTPAAVYARASKALKESKTEHMQSTPPQKEEKSTISRIISIIKDILSGKSNKKSKYDLEIK